MNVKRRLAIKPTHPIRLAEAELIKLQRPSYTELSREPISKLHATWRSNHKVLLCHIQKNEVPYFGLHGTPKENLDAILSSREGYFEMATFYDKKTDDLRIFQLYAMCSYVIGYGLREGIPGTIGGILIFDLQNHNGEIGWNAPGVDMKKGNITQPWEHLKGAGSFSLSAFSFDTDRNKRSLELLRYNHYERKNLLWRTGIGLDNDNFNKRFRGFVNILHLEPYIRKVSDLGRAMMAARFKAQIILGEVFESLQKPRIKSVTVSHSP